MHVVPARFARKAIKTKFLRDFYGFHASDYLINILDSDLAIFFENEMLCMLRKLESSILRW